MNTYGEMARTHWARWLPQRYATLDDPSSFFSTLGEEVAEEIADLSLELAGDDPPGETYLEKLGRLSMARVQAEERVLAERVLLTPEPGTEDDETGGDEEPAEQTTNPASEWIPLVEDPTHPFWQQVAAERAAEEVAEQTGPAATPPAPPASSPAPNSPS